MKLQSSPDQIIITQSGVASIFVAIVLIVAGIVLAVATLLNKSPLYLPAIGGLLVFVGVFIGWTAQSMKTILRKTGPSTVSTTRLITHATVDNSFEASQVVRVELITASVADTNQQQQTPSRRSTLKLILNDNTEVLLGEKTRSSGLSVNGVSMSNFVQAPLQKEAQIVADFLGMPLNAADMSNPITALQSILHPGQTPQTQPVAPAQQSTPAASPAPLSPVAPNNIPTPVPSAPATPQQQPVAPPVDTLPGDQSQRF